MYIYRIGHPEFTDDSASTILSFYN